MNKHIMIVDDIAANINVMIYKLAKFGEFQYICCKDVETAIKKCTEFDYKLILMDHEIAEDNGLDASKKMLAINPQLPIVSWSSNNEYESFRKKYEAIGITDFLTKPIQDDDMLENIVKKYLL